MFLLGASRDKPEIRTDWISSYKMLAVADIKSNQFLK
jgi:hypothetical protein